MSALQVTRLEPACYRRTPWRNGGGVTTDIAGEGDVWRFSRTPIAAAGPFSDYAGYDRLQVLVAGGGLVLQTPDGEIDVRRPFVPIRFAGETPIVSRLEDGPVEVVNLLGERRAVRLALAVPETGVAHTLGAGLHLAYCPDGSAILGLAGEEHRLAADQTLRIEHTAGQSLTVVAGRIVLGSIECVLPS
ncbi:MAG: HutD family protein [Reyranellaceae bacterium]